MATSGARQPCPRRQAAAELFCLAAMPVSSDGARESVPESSRRRCNEGLKRRVGCQRGMCEMVDPCQGWA